MKHTLSILSALTLAGTALAAPQTFDFKDPKGVNNAVFKLDAPLEAINGSANGVTGSVTFDPEQPGAAKGKIVVAAKSLTVPNPMMQEHMAGEKWLDVKQFGEISFDVKSLANVKTTGNETTADASGTFTLKGVAKEMTVPVKLTYLKDKLSARVPNLNGDLLVVRSTFQIKRADFGIMPGQAADKVAETIEIVLSIAGASAK
jgi:polyisoprenoid-binding protein YceI